MILNLPDVLKEEPFISGFIVLMCQSALTSNVQIRPDKNENNSIYICDCSYDLYLIVVLIVYITMYITSICMR